MRILRHPLDVERRPDRVAAYGPFDGLHRGHLLLLDELGRYPSDDRAVILDETAIGYPRLSSRRRVLEEVAVRGVAVAMVVVDRERDLARGLRALAPAQVLVATGEPHPDLRGEDVVPPVREVAAVRMGEAPITSARLRTAVVAGDIAAAERMLDRPYAVDGRVVHGHHRGSTIGVPTANLRIDDLLLPPDGVYAVTVRSRLHTGVGVANLGTNPTFGNESRSLEVHVFDFAGDLYGTRIEVGFVERLRGERKFDGVDALVAQIRRDIDTARAVHRRR